jgi:hypothetical protein
MSLFRLHPMAIGLAVALGLALPAAPGGQGNKVPTPTAEAAAQVARHVYAVRGGQTKELVSVLNLHFRAAPAFAAVADPRGGSLLLSGPKSVLDEALAVLHNIDHPARTIHLEVLLVELAGKAGGESSGDGKDLNRAEWEGSVGDVAARVRDLQKRGSITRLERIQVTALEGQSIRTRASESRPYTTSVAFGGGFRGAGGFGGGGGFPGAAGAPGAGRAAQEGGRGAPVGSPMSRSISYRELGTSVQVKPEITADGTVALELHVEDSRMRAAEGVALATDEKGANLPATEFVTSSLESKLKVRPGYVVLAQAKAIAWKSGQTQALVLVSAVTE